MKRVVPKILNYYKKNPGFNHVCYSRREVSCAPSLTGCVRSVGCKATSELIGSRFFIETAVSRNKTNSVDYGGGGASNRL